MTRAFVAVRPPEPVLDAVGERVRGLAALGLTGLRWTTPDQWHLTLQFLGNRVDLDAVASALRGIDEPAGPVALGGGGAFPSARRTTVLWLGVREGADVLARLAAVVGALVAPLGHVPEDRDYHAHLTVARCKVPSDLRGPVWALGDAAVGEPWLLDEIVLYESTLRRDGSQYHERAVVPLPRPG